MTHLRPYQADGIERLRQSLRSNDRTILQAPTGSGKTVTFAAITKAAAEKGKDTLILVSRRELAYQAVEKLGKVGVRAGLIMAGESMDVFAPVQVASFDTLHHRAIRRDKIPLPDAHLVITDEAHLSMAGTRLGILQAYPHAKHIGFTATPARRDGKALGEFWQDLVIGPPVRQLMNDGYLVPRIRYYAPTEVDLSDCRTRAGDWVEADIDGKLNQPKLVGDVVDHWFRLAEGRSTAVFAITRSHGRNLLEAFKRRGVRAEYVDGNTDPDDRAAILSRVGSGKTTVLVNVLVATYGLDIPRLECAVIARPTKSIVMYHQIGGRILRPFEGKSEAIIIDHGGVTNELGFIEDEIDWSLSSGTVQERLEQKKKEKKEPKEMTCPKCRAVFKGSRFCPSCGYEMVPPGKPVPVWQADLVEVIPGEKAANRKDDVSIKMQFFGEMLFHAETKGYSHGWAAYQYKDKYGVFPSGPTRFVRPKPMTSLGRGWVARLAILAKKGYGKRRARA